MQTRSRTTRTPSLCWDVYYIICGYDWKILPKLMRTCKTLYNRLKPRLSIVAATIPPTMYEQRKYTKEILLPTMMENHDTDWFGHNLYKLKHEPVHLKVGNDEKDGWWMSFIGSNDECIEAITRKQRKKFIQSCTTAIMRYLETGYQLLFWSRIRCLCWRPISTQQREDIVMRMFYQDLAVLIGCNVKEYLIKHPILDATTNRNVHIYIDPDHTASHSENPDVYGTLVRFLHTFYHKDDAMPVDSYNIDVEEVLAKMTEPYWLLE